MVGQNFHFGTFMPSVKWEPTCALHFPEGREVFIPSPTLAFGHRLRGKEGDSYGAMQEKPLA